ncbi:MAG: acyltransferase [Acutalibacteraceae bacterium]
MEEITKLATEASQNKVIGNVQNDSIDGAKIIFKGTGNILVIEDGVKLCSSTVLFNGSNAVCYLSANKNPYYINLTINNNGCIYFGRDCYINGKMTLITSEQQNIIIGNEGLFSFGIFIRTADPHLIYDCGSGRRINPSKSVFIGDHVWIGQDVLILKGTTIGSGAIVGGASLLSNKRIPSNTACGGNPAKIIRRGVFFSKECVHTWTDEQSENYKTMKTDKYTYKADLSTVSPELIDSELKESRTAEERLEVVRKRLVKETGKNRFFIGEGEEDTKPGHRRLFRR